MDELPQGAADLVGLLWEEARELLAAEEIQFQSVITRPPGKDLGEEPLRVVAQRHRPQGQLLVLAYRDYKRSDQAPPAHGSGG